MTITSVDWDFWLSLPNVKVWEAVALSLGLDPEKMNQSRDYFKHAPEDQDVPNARLREEFGLRVHLLVGALTDSALFSSETRSTDTSANHRVRLKQVAEWLQSIGRTPLADPFLTRLALTPAGTTAVPDPATTLVRPVQPLDGGTPPAAPPARPMHVWQEEQIRRTVRSLGYDPLALPTDDPKNDVCVKSLIRTRCEKNHPVKMRASIFNKAWERLLNCQPPLLRYAA